MFSCNCDELHLEMPSEAAVSLTLQSLLLWLRALHALFRLMPEPLLRHQQSCMLRGRANNQPDKLFCRQIDMTKPPKGYVPAERALGTSCSWAEAQLEELCLGCGL